MTTCSTAVCGTGDWNGPLPGDPDNNSVLTASPAFGGIDVSWSYPSTNPYAVAHTLLYRGLSSNFNTAIQIAVVSGNFFYDKSTLSNPPTYFYWIKIVSVNGTEGALIGPASAKAKGTIAEVIEGLTNQIDSGLLATALRTEIDKITINGQSITAEADARIAANTALSAALAQVQSGVEESITLINEEITQRQEGDSSLVSQVNTVAAANATNLALIQTEQTARVAADSANAALYTTLNSQVNNATTGLPATRATLLNDYYTKASTDSAISSATASLLSSSALNSALGAYTTTAALQTNYYTKTGTDGAISAAITTSQATLNGSIASAQTTLQTNIDTVDGKVTGIGARYTAVLSVNGLIGGFGVYNNGTTVEAGFDVDSFWVGKTQANKRKPFIISGGVTYIDDAAIEKLTFTKLRDASGSVLIENGKIKANYLQVLEIYGGSFTGFAWPATGNGFYLGPNGLLLGNANTNKYFQVYHDGNVYAPGFSIVNGNATFSGNLTANTVTTNSIVGNAVSQSYTSATSGSSTSLSVSVPDGTASVVVMVGIGAGIFVGTGSGENSGQVFYPPVGKLLINGTTVVTEATSAIVWCASSPAAGTYTVNAQRSQYSDNMYLVVMVNKR